MTYKKIKKMNFVISIVCPAVTCILSFTHLPYSVPLMVFFMSCFIIWHLKLAAIDTARTEVHTWACVWCEVIGMERFNEILNHTVEQDTKMWSKLKYSRGIDVVHSLYPDLKV